MGLTATYKQRAATVAAVTSKLTGSIGSAIDQLHSIREAKRELEAKIKVLEGEYEGVETQLMETLAAQGLDASRGKVASVSISTSVVGNVTDWDALYKYVKRTGYFHLFQRRLADASVRELFEQKGAKAIPGVEPFTKKRLNVRSL